MKQLLEIIKVTKGHIVFQKLNTCSGSTLLKIPRRHQHFHNNNIYGNYDMVVVGGGIVGVASAREIKLRHPNLKMAILEKEKQLAVHQSGHNSGVVHAGIYYKPGTLKAQLCVEGLQLAYKYFDEKEIPHKKCGKLIVARNQLEVERLMDLHKRGLQNNVPDLMVIDGPQIKDIEPYCEGVKALHSPHTGIVDWAFVTKCYGDDFKRCGGKIFTNFKVTKFDENRDGDSDTNYPIAIMGAKSNQCIRCRYVLTCGGLQSDQLAKLTGCSPSPRIIPFRGEYLVLSSELSHIVCGNIYPVPDPRFPFLGVHFTPRMDGSIWLGPNAVLAFKREGYKWSDVDPVELFNTLRYSGFRKLALKYFTFGVGEVLNSMMISRQVAELRTYIPRLTEYEVSRGPSGVRAQALDEDGNLFDDFLFDRGASANVLSTNVLHCRNAPSPGATSSLAIARMVADRIEKEFDIGKTC